MMQAVTGLHMNPLPALLLVVGLVFATPWALRRLRRRVPALLGGRAGAERGLQVRDAVPLGSKRTLFSVVVRGEEGRKATAVILTGGPADLCIGWLEDGRDMPSPPGGCSSPQTGPSPAVRAGTGVGTGERGDRDGGA